MTNKKRQKRHALCCSSLYRIRRRKDLARILKLEVKELAKITGQEFYSVKNIITEKSKKRLTETPTKALRKVHERLTRLLMKIEPPKYLYCPVKGRSQIRNAARHRHSKVICTLDVREYFPSTPESKIYWFFRHTMKCAPDVSAILAKIATREGHLPTGSPLSPILAFYAFFSMWNAIAHIATDGGCIVTVYMDDITVSGVDVPGTLMWKIKQQIHGAGLRYHKVYKNGNDLTAAAR